MKPSSHIHILDATLRDGEQVPGFAFTPAEADGKELFVKTRIANSVDEPADASFLIPYGRFI